MSKETFGSYVILEQLHSSETCDVHLVRATPGPPGALVLKRAKPAVAGEASFRQSFLESAQLGAASSSIEGVCAIREVGTQDGQPFLCRDYAPGKDLRLLLRRLAIQRRLIPQAAALDIGLQVARALGRTRATAQLIHGCLTPQDIIIDFAGAVQLINLGRESYFGLTGKLREQWLRDRRAYSAPEWLTGRGPLSQAADVFSLGAILYELLTGRQLYPEGVPAEHPEQRQLPEVIVPSSIQQGIPQEVDALILQAVTIDPAARVLTMDEVLQTLEAVAGQRRAGEKRDADSPTGHARHLELAELMASVFPNDLRLEKDRQTSWAAADTQEPLPAVTAQDGDAEAPASSMAVGDGSSRPQEKLLQAERSIDRPRDNAPVLAHPGNSGTISQAQHARRWMLPLGLAAVVLLAGGLYLARGSRDAVEQGKTAALAEQQQGQAVAAIIPKRSHQASENHPADRAHKAAKTDRSAQAPSSAGAATGAAQATARPQAPATDKIAGSVQAPEAGLKKDDQRRLTKRESALAKRATRSKERSRSRSSRHGFFSTHRVADKGGAGKKMPKSNVTAAAPAPYRSIHPADDNKAVSQDPLKQKEMKRDEKRAAAEILAAASTGNTGSTRTTGSTNDPDLKSSESSSPSTPPLPPKGYINISCPVPIDVIVDGWRTPVKGGAINLQLAAGRHQVTIIFKESGKSLAKLMEVKSGKTIKLRLVRD